MLLEVITTFFSVHRLLIAFFIQIPVVADVYGVGANLQDHVGVNGLVWTLPPDPDFFTRYPEALKQYKRDSTG